MNSIEYLDYISKIITPLATILALVVAFYGIIVWKKQLRGRNTYDLARRVLTLLFRLRDSVYILRPLIKMKTTFEMMIVNSIRNIDETKLKEMSFSEYLNQSIFKDPYNKFLEYDGQLKYENVEVEVLFGKELSKQIEEFLENVVSFYNNYTVYVSNIIAREKQDFYYLLGDDYSEDFIFRNEKNDDAFSIKMSESIQKIEKALYPFLKLKK